jgi:hypothetical protein
LRIYNTSLRSLECGLPRTLHLPPVESSHQLLDHTRGLGRLSLATLLLCIVLCIVGLLALETWPAVHTAGSFGDCLGAALLVAAPAAPMRLTVRRAASLGGLGATHVLAAPAPTMHVTELLASSSSSEAALLLAPPAASMRDVVRRAASFSSLKAAILLAPPATPMRLAGTRVAYGGLGTALLLAPFSPAMRNAVRRATA